MNRSAWCLEQSSSCPVERRFGEGWGQTEEGSGGLSHLPSLVKVDHNPTDPSRQSPAFRPGGQGPLVAEVRYLPRLLLQDGQVLLQLIQPPVGIFAGRCDCKWRGQKSDGYCTGMSPGARKGWQVLVWGNRVKGGADPLKSQAGRLPALQGFTHFGAPAWRGSAAPR